MKAAAPDWRTLEIEIAEAEVDVSNDETGITWAAPRLEDLA